VEIVDQTYLPLVGRRGTDSPAPWPSTPRCSCTNTFLLRRRSGVRPD
jgi:hypothetical protein